MKTWLISMTSLCALGVSLVQAQQAQMPAASVRQACEADMQKLCAGVRPGGGRVKECFNEHKDELSAECRDALQAAQEKKSH